MVPGGPMRSVCGKAKVGGMALWWLWRWGGGPKAASGAISAVGSASSAELMAARRELGVARSRSHCGMAARANSGGGMPGGGMPQCGCRSGMPG
eukprot:scaffold60945_cov18-Phaeocystis_antarctica.AAC.1